MNNIFSVFSFLHQTHVNSVTPDHFFLELPETGLAGNPRVQFGRIDMGAYEASVLTVGHLVPITARASLRVFPNPARSFITIVFSHEQGCSNTILTLVNSKGQLVHELISGILAAGHHNLSVDLATASLQQCMYFVVAENGESKAAERVVVF